MFSVYTLLRNAEVNYALQLRKWIDKTRSGSVTRKFRIVFVLFSIIFPQILCTRFLDNYSTDLDKFFTDDGTLSEFYMFLNFLSSSLPVRIYGRFCNFLRPILCRVDLRNYKRYDFEIFRIGRAWFEVVHYLVVLHQWRYSLELA